MNVTITSQHLPGGWDHYCQGCDMFFSVYSDPQKKITYCPVCGGEALFKDPKEFEAAFPHYQYLEVS